MQLLKGSNILLYIGDVTETVSNVLIGEPSADGKCYTLGIPKGDSHIWSDRKVCFFGRTFRTIGLPEQGIEENIPLSWHKKVHVKMLDSTGSVTVYEKDTFTRHIFSEVYCHDGRGEKVNKTGALPSGDIDVRIYSFSHDNSYIPKAGDMIVCGECEFEFDNSSQIYVSESMAQFRKLFPEFSDIKAVSIELNGDKPDIIITGR
ncbi:MAG: hypothetical protein K6G20_12890 [Ruminococcus sp.]|nr:hypothetical protein [Ruminococcus sp.]